MFSRDMDALLDVLNAEVTVARNDGNMVTMPRTFMFDFEEAQ